MHLYLVKTSKFLVDAIDGVGNRGDNEYIYSAEQETNDF